MKTYARELISGLIIAFLVGSLIGVLEGASLIIRRNLTSPDSVLVLITYGSLGYGLLSAIVATLWHLIRVRRKRLSPDQAWATNISIPVAVFVGVSALSLVYGSALHYIFLVPASISLVVILCLTVPKVLLHFKSLGSVQSWLILHATALAVVTLLIARRYNTEWRSFGTAAAITALSGLICLLIFQSTRKNALLSFMINLFLAACLALLPVWRQLNPNAVSAKQDHLNILLITIDTIRPDHLGSYGYKNARTPHLDRIAGEGVMFLETVAPVAFTCPSHATILTGLYPIRHGALDNGTPLDDEVPTLPEMLELYGYRTAAFVSGVTLKDEMCGLAGRFQEYDDNFSTWRWLPQVALKLRLFSITRMLSPTLKMNLRRAERPAAETTNRVLGWLKDFRTNEHPFFLWVHYFDPHYPYTPPPPYDTIHDPLYKGTVNGRFWENDANKRDEITKKDREIQHIIALYDGEITYVDAEIGRLLSALKKWKLDQNTLIVVTGDHGEGLGEHGLYFAHSQQLYDTSLRVPLIFKIPSFQRSGQISGQTRLIDIAPTIIDLIGVKVSMGFEGESLLRLITDGESESERPAFAQVRTRPFESRKVIYAIRDKGYKLIWTSSSWDVFVRVPPQEELYELGSDTGELKNILLENPPVLSDLRQALSREIRKKVGPRPSVDHELREQLKSLGYL